jgi:hypothetical protein
MHGSTTADHARKKHPAPYSRDMRSPLNQIPTEDRHRLRGARAADY